MALLDALTSVVAFDLKKLRTAYAGACLRIRPAATAVETDIGFAANGDLDWTAVAAIGSDVRVVKIYDQSTNAFHFTALANANQAVLNQTTKTLDFDGTATGYSTPFIDLSAVAALSIFTRHKSNNTAPTQGIAELGADWNSVVGAFNLYVAGGALEAGAANAGTYNYKSKATDTGFHTLSLIIDKSLTAAAITKMRVDASLTGVTSPSAQAIGTFFSLNKIYLGNRADTNLFLNGSITGFAVLQGAIADADRDAIEAAIGVQNAGGTPAATTDIFCGVDSRQRGTDPAGQTPTQSTPHQLALVLIANSVSFDGSFVIPNDAAKTTTVKNKGVNSRTLAAFVASNMATELSSSATTKIFINESGINDLFSGATTTATIQSFADVQTYCNANAVTHYPTTIDKIALGTIHTDAALVGVINGKVDTVNAALLSTYPTKLVEFNRNATLLDITNTATSPDGVHSSPTAKAIKARMIADRMNNTVAFPAFTTASLAAATQNAAYSQPLTFTGSPTSFTLTGTLPTGITFNAATGAFSGTPTQTGTFPNLIVRAIRANGDFTEKTYSITVNAPGGGNTAPTANAGTDQTITLPASANLTGTASDDGFGGSTLATVWSKFSGLGAVTFGNANALNTTAAFSAAGVYVLRLTASDGTLSTTDDVQITVNAAGGDTTAPTGAITSPVASQVVSGTVSLTTNAADNVAVASVQFKIDGVNFGSPDLTAPYSIALNTTTLTDGVHAVTALITDTAATPNTFTTPAVSFTVNNSPAGIPQMIRVAITAPSLATGVRLKRTTNNLIDFELIRDFANAANFDDTINLEVGKTYYYRAATRNANGVYSEYGVIQMIQFANG